MDEMEDPVHMQAQTIIIIHPGSMYLKIGRASDLNPHMELHAIARMRSKGGGVHVDTLLPQVITNLDPNVELEVDYCRLQVSHALQSCVMSDGQKRYATPPQQISQYNKRSVPETVNITGPQPYKSNNNVAIGNEVLCLDPESELDYNIHFPMKRGDLNVHSGIGGSLTGVLTDLETIWSHIIVTNLNIPLNTLKHYRAVLIIPDVYNRQYLKELTNLILDMGFSSCFLLQDHVAATFGAGVGSACVIDCGHAKTSISCVEDGTSHPVTRIRLPYGGGDISQCLHWLLNRCGFPYKECDLTNNYDALLIEKIKQESCHVNLDVCGCKEKTFTPEIFSFTANKPIVTQKRTAGDSSDPHDAEYLRETSRKGTKDVQDPSTDALDDGDILDMDVSTDYEFSYGQLQFLPLDQAIIQSIQRCPTDDMKRRMFGNIVVVGGGMKFKGIANWLKTKLEYQIPINLKPETVEIISSPKEMDPVMTVWKGAAILSCLESAQELWITKEEFMKFGVKILRERSPFIW
ncbi:actin-related protein 8 isoform X2 [Cimex lectularius]|uniref:Actin-related protein 8 n=1 Tax=Cimex lectularius TaxID=79782 RepID=A0A8I6RVZ1_CIMLE|nr:actin-related protein 8 isoform X2 [Cimex lectularius]